MNGKTLDLGLLVLRLGLGALFVVHGKDKVFGGPEIWKGTGAYALAPFNIDVGLTYFGAAAAFSEFLGGLLVALGLAFRPACAALTFTMFVAVAAHLQHGDGFDKWAHGATCFVGFLGLLLTGPGKFSVRKG